MNQPVDLYSLQLIRLVAEHRSFSAAAKEAGISQSALSRQIANAELRLELKLFERTTRQVRITEAGAILLRETAAIPNLLEGALNRLREECLDIPPKINICLSSELSLAHMPGLFNLKSSTARIVVSQEKSPDLISGLGAARYDLGILADPSNLPENLAVTHRIKDRFALIAPSSDPAISFADCLNSDSWILPPPNSQDRLIIDRSFPGLKASMEIENFDLMIHLVALGMGCAIVPRRALSTFSRKKLLRKILLPVPLERRIIVAVPKHLKTSEHVGNFVAQILFS